MQYKFYPSFSEFEPNIVPMVNSITAYDYPYGNTYLPRFNKYFGVVQ